MSKTIVGVCKGGRLLAKASADLRECQAKAKTGIVGAVHLTISTDISLAMPVDEDVSPERLKEMLKAQLWAQFEQRDFARFITVAGAEHLMAV